MDNVQILISTMNNCGNEISLLNKMNIQTGVLVINQCDLSGKRNFEYRDNHVCWIDSCDKGLSKSRNLALTNASSEIGVLADDDLIYCNDYVIKIQNSFKKLPHADIIAFQVRGIEREFKKYYPMPRKINYFTSMKISSVQIAFKLSSIRKNNILFDDMFGAGAKFYMGEENIFLFDCLRKGLNIYYVPEVIANLHIGDSSWFSGFNERYFHDKGAAFTRLSARYALLLIIQFALRKYSLYKKETGFLQAVKYMLNGRKAYQYDIANIRHA